MPSPDDWTEAPFARVFVTFPEDYPDLWRDKELLGWWLTVHLTADRAYPMAPPWPRTIPDTIVDRLVASGAVEAVGEDHYRIHGMAKLMASIDRRYRAGGKARAAMGRDPKTGHLLPRDAGGNAGELNGKAPADAGGGTLVETLVEPEGGYALTDPPAPTLVNAGETLVRNAGASVISTPPANETRRDETGEGPSKAPSPVDWSSSTLARAREADPDPDPDRAVDPLGPTTVSEYRSAVASHGPDDAPCDEPDLHPLHHRWYAGVGWRCLLCEHSDSRTFRERMEAANAVALADDSRPF